MNANGDSRGDRYEPLPSIPELPGWIWRKLPLAAKVLLAAIPVVAVVLYFVLSPGIDRGKDERARSEQQRLEANRQARSDRQRADARPRQARVTVLAPAGASSAQLLAGRERALDQMSTAILHDARTRGLEGPIKRVECEPYPRTVENSGAENDLSRRSGRYSCIAVTADVERTATQGTGIIGHPYRALMDFESGRYAFCKISGRAGEGSLGVVHPVGVPTVCGGR